MNENEFWNSTLRKIDGLIEVYNKIKGSPAQEEPEALTGQDAINSLMSFI